MQISLALPVIAVGTLCTVALTAAGQNLLTVAYLENSVNEGAFFSALVESLQRERGMSCTFLSGKT